MRTLSLFSGCGGLDLGFKLEGFQCAGAYDFDEEAIDTFKANVSSNAYNQNVCDLTRKELESKGKIAVLLAGPPCQGFSTLGKNLHNDERNELLFKVAEISSWIRPEVIVVENVKGLVSGKYREKYWKPFLRELENLDYQVPYTIAHAEDYGLPQTRKRVILVAHRRAKPIVLDFEKRKRKNLREALDNIENTPQHFPLVLDQDEQERLVCLSEVIQQGQKLSDVRSGPTSIHSWKIPKLFGNVESSEELVLETILSLRRSQKHRKRSAGDADPVTVLDVSQELGIDTKPIIEALCEKGFLRRIGVDLFDMSRGFNGKYRRLSWEGSATAVDTRFGDPRYFLHPEGNRGFSVREAARIQGFPDDFLFQGSTSAQFRMIGNAVPPPLSRSIACFIKKKMLKEIK